ncbi:burnettramic acids biosynthesis cluster protein E [Trichoderma asperellum]|uniref:Burnettramic acids biosynthesis cluster protein E n=1 Tax=Trichoderma asperellum TaxID=101201 RepID=A0A6V8R4A1_TRIAP|nr:burnettramic acids biosynthesis cluster protein E [Trichoderma asperellum]
MQPQQHGSHQSDEYGSSDSDEHDGPVKADPETSRDLEEAAWSLDAAQSQLEPPPDYATVMEQDIDANAMAEGFNAGIDQATFMDFIKELNLATAPSPWIHAINLAAVAVQNVPEPITIAVSIAAQRATQVSLQAHSRSKTNAFLNKVNAEFFLPLGLIAIIMTWKPSTPGEVVTQVTFDAAIDQAAQNASGSGSGSSGVRNKMQASHGTTNFEWPESAPLVFPTLDKLSSTAEGRQAVEEAEKKQPNSMKRSMLFAMDYMDKRAQAQYANDHPESQLSQLGVKPEFHSRYADPNHPASSGSILALLTGGCLISNDHQLAVS